MLFPFLLGSLLQRPKTMSPLSNHTSQRCPTHQSSCMVWRKTWLVQYDENSKCNRSLQVLHTLRCLEPLTCHLRPLSQIHCKGAEQTPRATVFQEISPPSGRVQYGGMVVRPPEVYCMMKITLHIPCPNKESLQSKSSLQTIWTRSGDITGVATGPPTSAGLETIW